MFRSCSFAAFAVSSALLIASCSSETPHAAGCMPYATHACTCPDGAVSIQTCAADGRSYSACACGGGGSTAGTSGIGLPNGGNGGTSGTLPDGAVVAIDGSLGPIDGSTGLPPGEPGVVFANPSDEASYLFDDAQLRTYNLVIAQTELDKINASPMAEMYAQGMVEFEGKSYGPVGIRYKGSTGAFFAPCTATPLLSGQPSGPKAGKCSMKVAFDFVDPEARFYGLKKLNFHSMNNDDSMLRERLAYAMFRESGIAASRIVHARVTVNGKLEGLFAMIEQVDGRFTRGRFEEGGKGNLYKEIWPIHDDAQLYLNSLESNKNDMPSAQRMLSFKSAIATSADAAAMWLDRDYLLTYLAVDRVIVNDDGIMHWWCSKGGQGNNYPSGRGNHNYYWYEAAQADRLWLIPWDMDFSFNQEQLVQIHPEWRQTAACTCGFGLAMPASCDPLIQRFIEWNTDYETAVDAFIAGPFAASNVDAKLNAWKTQIEAVVNEASGMNGAPTSATWQSAVTSLQTVIGNARQNRGVIY